MCFTLLLRELSVSIIPPILARSKRGSPGPSTQIGQRERLPHGEAVYYDAAALERAASEGGPYKSVRRIDHE